MGMLNSNPGMGGQSDWLAKMLGRGGYAGFSSFPTQAPSARAAPAQSGMSPSTGIPASYWWNQPGAGTGAVTQAPALNNRGLSQFLGFGAY